MKYDHVTFFENKLREIAKAEDVLDVGGGRPFQKGMAKYREWFAGKEYRTLDAAEEYEPDIVGDIHNIPLADNSVGAIICKSVLEHLPNPKKAVQEMNRVLKQGGQLLAYTHFVYPYHAREGVYGDYYRFTETALRDLFQDFSTVEIKKEGGYFRALCFFLPFQARFKFVWEPVACVLDKLFCTETKTTTAGFYVYAVK